MTIIGRRSWKKVTDKTTYCLYADKGLIGEYDEMCALRMFWGASELRFFRHNLLCARLHSYDYATEPLLLDPDDFLLEQAAIIGGQQTSFHVQRIWNMLQRGLQQ